MRIRSLGIPGEYVVERDGAEIAWIARCSWSNASTDGINSPRPYWTVTDQEIGGKVLFEATTKKACTDWAREFLNG